MAFPLMLQQMIVFVIKHLKRGTLPLPGLSLYTRGLGMMPPSDWRLFISFLSGRFAVRMTLPAEADEQSDVKPLPVQSCKEPPYSRVSL